VLVAVVLLALRWSGLVESIAFYWPSLPPEDAITPRGLEDVWFNNSDGETLHGWWMPATTPEAKGTVLFCHGNAGSVDSHTGFVNFVREAGYNALLFDYRTYGRSEGDPFLLRRGHLVDDGHAAMAYLRSRKDTGSVVLMGHSLGASVAAELFRTEMDAEALALIAPFATWQSIASDHVPALGGLLVHRGVDAADNIRAHRGRPIAVIHGKADRIVPVHHALAIQEAGEQSGAAISIHLEREADHISITSYPLARKTIISVFDRATRD